MKNAVRYVGRFLFWIVVLALLAEGALRLAGKPTGEYRYFILRLLDFSILPPNRSSWASDRSIT